MWLLLLACSTDPVPEATPQAAPAVEAAPPEPDRACDDSVRVVSHIPPTADMVKIDRYVGEEVTHHQLKIYEVERVIVTEEALAGGETCSGIFIESTSGERLLFDSSTTTSLRKQGQKIANGLGKRLKLEEVIPAETEGSSPESEGAAGG